MIGNCLLLILNANVVLLGIKSIRGMKISSPLLYYDRILAKCWCNPVIIINLIPLHIHRLESKILNGIITTPTFNNRTCGCIPDRWCSIISEFYRGKFNTSDESSTGSTESKLYIVYHCCWNTTWDVNNLPIWCLSVHSNICWWSKVVSSIIITLCDI